MGGVIGELFIIGVYKGLVPFGRMIYVAGDGYSGSSVCTDKFACGVFGFRGVASGYGRVGTGYWDWVDGTQRLGRRERMVGAPHLAEERGPGAGW